MKKHQNKAFIGMGWSLRRPAKSFSCGGTTETFTPLPGDLRTRVRQISYGDGFRVVNRLQATSDKNITGKRISAVQCHQANDIITSNASFKTSHHDFSNNSTSNCKTERQFHLKTKPEQHFKWIPKQKFQASPMTLLEKSNSDKGPNRSTAFGVWQKHLLWNKKMLQQTSFQKRSLKKLHQWTSSEQEIHTLTPPSNMLEMKGAIFAIVHLPSNSIYVHASCKKVYTAVKQQWYSAHMRRSKFHKLLMKSRIREILVWPLELITSEDSETVQAKKTIWIQRIFKMSVDSQTPLTTVVNNSEGKNIEIEERPSTPPQRSETKHGNISPSKQKIASTWKHRSKEQQSSSTCFHDQIEDEQEKVISTRQVPSKISHADEQHSTTEEKPPDFSSLLTSTTYDLQFPLSVQAIHSEPALNDQQNTDLFIIHEEKAVSQSNLEEKQNSSNPVISSEIQQSAPVPKHFSKMQPDS